MQLVQFRTRITKERDDEMKLHNWSEEGGGIVAPAVLWWLGVPLSVVLVLWLLVF